MLPVAPLLGTVVFLAAGALDAVVVGLTGRAAGLLTALLGGILQV